MNVKNYQVYLGLLLLWIQLSVQSNTVQECPDDQFPRVVVTEFDVAQRCCQGITCHKDFEIKTCAKDGGAETCQRCPNGTTRPDITSSKDPKGCYSISPLCSEDSEPVHTANGKMECRCKSIYCGKPPDCRHVPCPPGKSADPITCECITGQTGASTRVPNTTSTTPPPQGSMTYAVNAITAGTTVSPLSDSMPTTGPTPSEVNGNEHGSNSHVVVGVIVGIVVVAVVVIVACFIWWRRRAAQNRRNNQDVGGRNQQPQRNDGPVGYTEISMDEEDDHTPLPQNGHIYLQDCNNVQISYGPGDNNVSLYANGGPAVHPSGGPSPSANGGPPVHPSGGETPSANGGPAVHPSDGPSPSANGGPAVHPSGGPSPFANGDPAVHPSGGQTSSANGGPAAEDMSARRPIEAMGSAIQEEGPSGEGPHASLLGTSNAISL